MAIEIIRRRDALAQGRVRYFTGKSCKRGHISERFVCDCSCAECGLKQAKKWNAANPEKRRKAKRRQWATNCEKYNEVRRKRYATNPEKLKEAARKCWAENSEKYRESRRKRRAANPEIFRDYYQKWLQANPERNLEIRRLGGHRRRARELGADGIHTHEQILNLFKKQNGKCASCFCSIKRGWENDHIIALACGGSNYISNIQLLCRPCNRRKSSKDPIIWAQQNGRLL